MAVQNFFDENPALFQAMNRLKSTSIVYKKYNPEDYGTLSDMRPMVNQILSYDGCYLDINTTFETACIRFIKTDDYVNRLREKFTADDMRVYVCLLQLYEEHYGIEGLFIKLDENELFDLFNSTGFTIGQSKKGSVSHTAITPILKKMAGYGIVRLFSDGYIEIRPGIITCISRDQFAQIYEDVVKPWMDSVNNADTDTTEDGNEPAEE